MSFSVVSSTGWPDVGKYAKDECKAWLDWRGLNACAWSEEDEASILMRALVGLPEVGLPPDEFLGDRGMNCGS